MDFNDLPYLILGSMAAVKDDSIRNVDEMISKGKEIAEGTKSKVKQTAEDRRLEATFQDLVKKGKKESEDLVDAIGKVIKDTLNSLGVVTKSDIKAVERRLDSVEKKLGPAPAGKKATAKKKAPAKKKAARKPAKKAPAKKK